MNLSKRNGWVEQGFRVTAVLNSLSVLVVLAVYAYGGWFSRYRADDYCESIFVTRAKNIFDAVIRAYNEWLNSYSTLFFVQLTDLAGLWGLRLLPGLIILSWIIVLIWLFSELEKAFGFHLGFAVRLWVSGLAIFLSLYQTPVLFQILYWRPVSIPYTLPLVFFVGIAASLFWYARQPYQKSRAVWMGAITLILVFFASGLGETDSAFQIGLLAVAVCAVWLTRSMHQRNDVLTILAVSLAGAAVSMLLMAVSPGTTNRLNIIMDSPPIYNPFELSMAVSIYTAQFLVEFFKVAPLPNLIGFAVPLAVMYFRASDGRDAGLQVSSARIRRVLVLIFLFMFFVIGCSFAPSAFTRTFPIARARFPAYFLVVFGLILEGGLLGILLSRFRSPVYQESARSMLVVMLAVLMLYPLFAVSKIYPSIEQYRNFAADWDVRDAQIKQAVAQGAKDLVVVQLDSVGDVGEYKGDKLRWINVCAAEYYGLVSLTAP